MRLRMATAGCAAALLGATVAAPAHGLTVKVDNQSGRDARSVFLMLSGAASSDGKLPNDVGVPLSAIGGSQFTVGDITSGRLYVSYGAKVTNAEPPTAPIRYDKVEFTTTGSAPTANLTAVDFFGIPFKLRSQNASGAALGTRAEPATATVMNALLKIPGARAATVPASGGGTARIRSPQLSPPRTYPSLDPYVRSMAGQRITIKGAFFGAPFTTFAYSGTFAADGSITLTGTTTPQGGQSAPGQPLAVQGASLSDAIYAGAGPYTVGGARRPPDPNDLYSAVYRDLVAGFAWGYWGGRYGNDTIAWCTNPDPRGYCPLGWNKPSFASARATAPAFTAFHGYASIISDLTDAYGFAYSDTGSVKTVLLPIDPRGTLTVTIVGDGSKAEGGSDAQADAAMLDDLGVRRTVTVGDDDTATVGRVSCPPACGEHAVRITGADGELDDDVVARGRAGADDRRRRPLEVRLTPRAQAYLAEHGELDARMTVTVRRPGAIVDRATTKIALRRG
ncbi:beta-1,3-glucanase family protein [Capillimicrobium parvum]|nr:beta-1,3-glucanase family protein [Capillimicrobium parvum]